MKKVLKERSDIAFFIKMFPLPIHPQAYEKAKAIVCEKSLSLLEDAFAKKALPPAKCKTTAVDDTIKLAAQLGISGTPTIIMPDGRLIPGFMQAKALIDMVDKK